MPSIWQCCLPFSGSVLTWETSQLVQLGYTPLETQVLATQAEMRQAISVREILVFIGTCSVTTALVSAFTKK